MKYILCSILLLSSLIVFSQESDTIEEIIDPIEIQPVFKGGMDSMWCYFESNLNIEKINSRNVKGRMFFEFIIDTLGNICEIESNPEYAKRFVLVSDSIVENEIISVLENMPLWKPALQFDRKVKSKYHLIINLPYSEFKCEKYLLDTTVYIKPDKFPDFIKTKGNNVNERVNNFIRQNLTWPSQDDCVGRVYVQFIVEKNGSTSNHKITRGICKPFDNEALRVVKLMNEWIPAYKNNKPVRALWNIPVYFMLE